MQTQGLLQAAWIGKCSAYTWDGVVCGYLEVDEITPTCGIDRRRKSLTLRWAIEAG